MGAISAGMSPGTAALIGATAGVAVETIVNDGPLEQGVARFVAILERLAADVDPGRA